MKLNPDQMYVMKHMLGGMQHFANVNNVSDLPAMVAAGVAQRSGAETEYGLEMFELLLALSRGDKTFHMMHPYITGVITLSQLANCAQFFPEYVDDFDNLYDGDSRLKDVEALGYKMVDRVYGDEFGGRVSELLRDLMRKENNFHNVSRTIQ